MAVKRSLWSLTLLPGERTPLFVQRDFCLTNAALGEELRSETGRTVVKVTHQPIPASLFDDDSESDEDDETEDEFELDEVEGFKLTPKKAKANGDADDEEDEDEEEEEDEVAGDGELEEDSEDDSDFSDEDDGLEQTNVLCSLLAGKIEQANLNLMFCEGDVVVFEATGENSVHLMGNYVIQPEPDLSDSEYDSDELYDGPDDFDEIYGDEDDSMDDEMDAEPDATIEEIVEKPVVAKAITKEEKPAKVKVVDAPESSKKRKAEEVESPAPKPAAGTEGPSKSQKKKLAKKAKLEAKGEDAPAPTTNGTAKGGDKQKKTLPSGLIIEDVKVGDGPVAKPGKRLGMRYIGKLENGKQFDANTSGAPFNFRLGRGEVIKGWDEGLSGMAVGGERRLTIPAALAYGSQKLPGIPKNSTLKFDVKLVSVS